MSSDPRGVDTPWRPARECALWLCVVWLVVQNLALGIACSSIIGYQWYNYRRSAAHDLKGQAELIAYPSSAALEFRIESDARDGLAPRPLRPRCSSS